MNEAPPGDSSGDAIENAGGNAGGRTGGSDHEHPASTHGAARPQRVRVTAPGSRADPSAAGAPGGTQRGAVLAEGVGDRRSTARSTAPSQVAEVYVTSLIRSQLRLALVVASGFLISLAAFAITLRLIPELEVVRWFGVPVAWLLLAFGVYPMIGLSAWLFVRAAARNESRYLALAEGGS